MDTFLSQYQDVVTGTLSTFDRIIFKGHLLQFFPKGPSPGFWPSKTFCSRTKTAASIG